MNTEIKETIIVAAVETAQECWETCSDVDQDALARASQNTNRWAVATDGLPMDGDYEHAAELVGHELSDEEAELFADEYLYHLSNLAEARWDMATKAQDEEMLRRANAEDVDLQAMEYVRNAGI